MKKNVQKLFTRFFVICYLAGLLFQIIPLTVRAEPAAEVSSTTVDPENMTSTEMAKDWGFATDVVPESSKKRQQSTENPMGAGKNTVKTFGETPLEIAIIGGKLYDTNDIESADYDTRDDIRLYDHFTTDGGWLKSVESSASKSNTDVFSYDKDESNIRPAKTVAADINGDGIDEILRYCIYVNKDGEIGKFNDHKDGYEAKYKLQVITKNGKVENEINLRTLSSKEFDKIALPGPVEYSSYIQMAAGDFDKDGLDEVVLAVPGKDSSTGELMIYGAKGSGSITLEKKFTHDVDFYSLNEKMTAFYLTTGDADNDGVEELLYTITCDADKKDEYSTLHIFDYDDNKYVETYNKAVKFNGEALGTDGDPVGNCGVTIGDIDNDSLNEVVAGGYMVNADTKDDNKFTNKSANGKEDTDRYYHELAMSYMKMEYRTDSDENITSKAYGSFKGFTVFEDDWETAYTSADGNDSIYDSDDRSRFKHSMDWVMQIQAVSLSGNVNGKTNDQIFFGNFMYYYNTEYGRFSPYDDMYESRGKLDDDMVVYKDIDAPRSSITGLVAGSFLSEDSNYVPGEGKEQLFVSYVRKRDKNHEYSHEIAVYYQDTGSTNSKDVKKYKNSVGETDHLYCYFPNVCAANLDNDAAFVQYSGYEFNYTKPEVLTVLAAAPYFEDVLNYNDYAGGGNYNPGQTYIRKTSGTSSSKSGFTEFKLGAYVSFSQDLSLFGVKIGSVEWETSFSANTSYEWRKTIEHSSSVTYSTDGGQDSVVVISAPQDTYFYRYYKETEEYHKACPGAVESDPSTWPVMAVNIPGSPQPRVIPVSNYNQLADTYKLEKVDGDFWEHTNGEPGTYPKSKEGFKKAKNILSSEPMSLNAGAGGVSAEVSVTETQEEEYTVSFTTAAKFGAGPGGYVFGATFENTTGFGGVKAKFTDTTFGAELGNFLGDGQDPNDLRNGYTLTTRLHSYTRKFNGNNIVVLDYTTDAYSGRPKLPNDFRVTNQQARKVSLAWDIPEVISEGLNPDSIELQRYDEYYKKYFTVKRFDTITLGDTMTYEDTDVYPEEKYKYRLKVLKLSKENYIEISAETPPYGVPAEIYKQPRDITTQEGSSVSFTLEAGLPEYAEPTRLYYEWYERSSDSKTWIRVEDEDVPESSTLTLDNVTSEMDGMQFYCSVSRLIKNSTNRITTNSDFVQLNVSKGAPQRYKVNFGTTLNGIIQAAEVSACGRQYPIKSGDTLFQETKVKFTATPDAGYGISSWIINNTKQDTHNLDYILKLNDNSTVSAVFDTFLYDVSFDILPNTEQNQGNEEWGTLTAASNSTKLPIGESTALNSRMPVIFTAAPKSGYAIDYWTLNGQTIKNADGTNFIGKTYTFNPIAQRTEIKVRFMKSVNYNVKVVKQIISGDVTYIDDSRLDISVDGFNNRNVPFTGSEAVLSVARGSEAEINLIPPTSAILDSWTVDGVPQKVDVPSLTVKDIAKDTIIYVNYKIFFSKTVSYTTSGAAGSVGAVLKSEKFQEAKPITSGTLVQMDQYAELTAQSIENLGVKTWIVNGKDTKSIENPYKVKIERNTSITAVLEAAPKPKEPGYKVNITGPVTYILNASDLAYDPDGDAVCFESISAAPDWKVAAANLNTGAKFINITGTDRGTTSIKAVLSDGKGHTLEVEVPIVVTNADQLAPAGLVGWEVADKFISNGKITGFDANKIYEYKKADAKDYSIFSGETELKYLEAGDYKVRYAAIKGYNASPDFTVNVPAYKPVYYTSIFANPFEGGKITGGSGFYPEGTRVTASGMANKGFTFAGWVDGLKIVGTEPEFSFVTGSKNTVLEARFKPIDTVITTGNVKTSAIIVGSKNNSITGVELEGAGGYKAGDSVTASVYGSPEDCEFAYWMEAGNIVSYNRKYEFEQPAGDRNLVACFQKEAYNVNVSSADKNRGTVSGTDIYKVGSSVTVTANSIGHSLFDYWTIDGEIAGTQSKLTFTMMPKDSKVIAHFKPLSHLVSLIANPGEAGTLTDGKFYNEGDEVTITAVAKAGYKFTGWIEGGITVSDKPEYKFSLGESDRCFVANFLKACQVSFNKNDGSTETVPTNLTVVCGENVGSLLISPIRTGYRFKGWNTAADGSGKAFNEATPIIEDMTVYAQWEKNTSTNGNGGTYVPAETEPDTQQKTVTQPEKIIPNAPAVKSGKGVTTVTVDITARSKGAGIAEATVPTEQVSEAVEKALKTGETQKCVTIEVYSPDNSTVETNIDKEAIKLISGSRIDMFSINTGIAVLTFDDKAVAAVLKEASGNIKITASSCSASEIKGLSKEQRERIGNRPVYDFSVKSGDKLISNFNGKVRITVPYTIKQDEDPNAIVIYYINDKNGLETITDCVYDSKSGTITFSTDHFSQYAVGYNKVMFRDVSGTAWYKDAITFASARGISTGMGEGMFNPDGKLTRGQFLVMLMRAYGITADTNLVNNFVDAGNTYYTGYLAKARALKLSQGTGGDFFRPEQIITREEMFTLLYNILKYLDKLPACTGPKTISDFSDVDRISVWSMEGMTLFVKAGIINGNNGLLMPKTVSNRAQIVQILYQLLSR